MSRKREQIVQTARKIIEADGYGAAGLERLLAEAGVAKMTLYNNFAGKDDVLVEAARSIDESNFEALTRQIGANLGSVQDLTPAGALRTLRSLVDALLDLTRERHDRGCVFLRSAGEFSAPDHGVRVTAREHYARVELLAESLAKRANLKSPARVAAELITLVAGAFSLTALRGDDSAITTVRRLARGLLAAAQP